MSPGIRVFCFSKALAAKTAKLPIKIAPPRNLIVFGFSEAAATSTAPATAPQNPAFTCVELTLRPLAHLTKCSQFLEITEYFHWPICDRA